MDTLTRADVSALLAKSKGPSVSILMPTHRAGVDRKQDPIRFRNLLKQADMQLRESGMRHSEVDSLLSAAQDLARDGMFWDYVDDGLAVFIRPAEVRILRLPVALEELVVVGDRFCVTPLIPAMDPGVHFFLLALSEKEVRFFRGSKFGMSIVDLPDDTPESLQDAFKYTLFEMPGARGLRKKRHRGVFKGHSVGGREREDNKQVRAYFRKIDRALHRVLGTETVPLVLAGVEYLMDAYRAETEYRHVVETVVAGNQDHSGVDDLHRQAWQIVNPIFAATRQKDAARVDHALGRGRAATALKELLPAAAQGRVEVLFVGEGAHEWGKVDEAGALVSHSAERRPGDADLLDSAALDAWTTEGTIYVVPSQEVPGGGTFAALLRF